jgi:hypothetical protein
MGIIDPLVELWNDLGQPPVLKLATIWNALVDLTANLVRLGFKTETMQANA